MSKSWIAACLVVVAGCSSGPSASAPAGRIILDPTRWIAYGHCVSCDGSDDQIWLVRSDGSGNHLITGHVASAYQPDYSRDGKSIAYEGGPIGTAPSQIYVATADGSDPHVAGDCALPSCQSHERPAWSPDGTRLAISAYFGPSRGNAQGTAGIAILELASGKVTPVTVHAVSSDPTGYDRVGEDRSARWSPDGQHLVFWRTRLSKDGVSPETAVFVVGSDGTDLRQLTPWDELAGDPDWSPNGALIVYSTHPNKVFATGESELVTIHPDGTGRTVITRFGPGGPRANHPRWVLDGSAILYMRRTGAGNATTVHVWVMRSDGTADAPVLTTEQIMGDPVMQP